MTPDERQLVARSRFRDLYGNASSRYGDSGPLLSEIERYLDRLKITDPPTRKRVVADCKRIAESARDEGSGIARQRADLLVLAFEQEIADSDLLLESDVPDRTVDREAEQEEATAFAADAFGSDVIGGRDALNADLAGVEDHWPDPSKAA